MKSHQKSRNSYSTSQTPSRPSQTRKTFELHCLSGSAKIWEATFVSADNSYNRWEPLVLLASPLQYTHTNIPHNMMTMISAAPMVKPFHS